MDITAAEWSDLKLENIANELLRIVMILKSEKNQVLEDFFFSKTIV